MTHRRRAGSSQRGFTLIELMVAAAIIGLLSSIAVPSYKKMTLRARTAERAAIMTSVVRAIGAAAMTREPQALPVDPMSGPWNPPGAPGTGRRVLDWTLGDWRRIPLIVEGSTFHSYSFTASDNVGVGQPWIVMSAIGDLDGDGVQSSRILTFTGIGYVFTLTSELPVPGSPLAEIY